tara:strand:+ start:417 stop:1307 length:891 start_codon:yes stop_codon:yes gene_type:complete
MKKTQIVTHLMPSELEDYSDMLDKLKESSEYLDDNDWISVQATLNLSPKIIDWDKSDVKSKVFIDYFLDLKQKCDWAEEVVFDIIDDNSILGTTSQKREIIKGDYNQFIFLDGDMIFHPTTLKYMLNTSYQTEGKYYVTPQIVRLWDTSWDILVHKDYMHIEPQKNGYYREHHPDLTLNQKVENVDVKLSPYFKFGCGWFVLYSKDILDLVGVPEFLGHYGPEDTYMMTASEIAKRKGYEINQYILDGIFVSENKIYRKNSYEDKLKYIDLKDEFRDGAWSKFKEGVSNFEKTLTR